MGTKEDRSYPPGMMDEHWSTFSSDYADYELGQTIGFGASSIVYSAVYRSSSHASSSRLHLSLPDNRGSSESLEAQFPPQERRQTLLREEEEEKTCAIKVSSHHPDIELLFKESRLLSLCRHPNVLRNLATFTLPPDHQRVALVTPLISGGSLAGILDWRSRLTVEPKHAHRPHLPRLRIGKKHEDEALRRGVLDEEEIKAVVKQVLEGLTYLHSKGFIHRDLKAGNLLVDSDGTILLGDFGVGGDMNDALTPPAKDRPPVEYLSFNETAPRNMPQDTCAPHMISPLEESGKRRSFVGTPNWMAPEVILGQKYDGKADIWSLGITILELALGAAPGIDAKPSKALSKTITQPPPTLDRSSGVFSKAMKEFVDTCLDKDPRSRPNAVELLIHPWLKGARKKHFLAESLLSKLKMPKESELNIADVPSLEARQEIRRIPSAMSMVSMASSWDFATSPALPASPRRSASNLPLRSPSILSYVGDYEGLPHARDPSRSSTHVSSISSSPRISLGQWAERTALEQSDRSWKRSMSEAGRQRSRPIRRRPSMPFDNDPRPQSMGGAVPSPRTRRLPSMEEVSDKSNLAEATGNVVKAIEIASPNTIKPVELSGLGIQNATSLSTSPEEIGISAAQPMSRGSTVMSQSTTHIAEFPTTPPHRSAERFKLTKSTPEAGPLSDENVHGTVMMEKIDSKTGKVKTHWWSRRPKEEKKERESVNRPVDR